MKKDKLMSGVNRKVIVAVIVGSGGERPELNDLFLVKCIY